eukprot:5268159-Amphidinium_carterae.1
MYSGQRRILVQGAVSDGVTATCGLPPGCGHAVDMFHVFLIKSLRCAGRQASSQVFDCCQHAGECPQDCRALQWICRLPPVQITTRDLGVDTQWFAWRNPVQQKRISSFRVSMTSTHALGLPAHVKAIIVKFFFSAGLYGAEVGGISDQRMKDLRASARGALGKGALLRRSAVLELMAHGGPFGDPRVAADLSTVRVWQHRIAAGKVQWPLPMASWAGALRRG